MVKLSVHDAVNAFAYYKNGNWHGRSVFDFETALLQGSLQEYGCNPQIQFEELADLFDHDGLYLKI